MLTNDPVGGDIFELLQDDPDADHLARPAETVEKVGLCDGDIRRSARSRHDEFR